jgi:glycosyltransferase involved in cell wall biosynthesis
MIKIKKIALLAVGDEAWIGGIQYTLNIVNSLNALSKKDSIELEIHILKHKNQILGDLSNFNNITIKTIDLDVVLPQFTLLNRFIWLLQRKLFSRINPRLENYLLRHNFDFVYPATLAGCGGKLNFGSWIADFQYYNFPEGHNSAATTSAERTISVIANKMPKVVFSSINSEEQGFNLYPSIIGKSHVMPFAVYIKKEYLMSDNNELIKLKYGIEGPYLIVSNLFAFVKNHTTLFKALGLLKQKGVVINLVCTGNFVNYARMDFTNEILQVINNTGIRNQIFILGLIPREDQIALYRMSFAMVQPSLHEGWSTCVEESKALGKTIIVSDIDVHREQNSKYAIYFDPMNVGELALKIEEVYNRDRNKIYPNLDVEKVAFKKYETDVQNFGKRFLEIASHNI